MCSKGQGVGVTPTPWPLLQDYDDALGQATDNPVGGARVIPPSPPPPPPPPRQSRRRAADTRPHPHTACAKCYVICVPAHRATPGASETPATAPCSRSSRPPVPLSRKRALARRATDPCRRARGRVYAAGAKFSCFGLPRHGMFASVHAGRSRPTLNPCPCTLADARWRPRPHRRWSGRGACHGADRARRAARVATR